MKIASLIIRLLILAPVTLLAKDQQLDWYDEAALSVQEEYFPAETDWLKDVKSLWTNRIPENPWFQSFDFSGRIQYQVTFSDFNDVNGQDFDTVSDEVRRYRYTTTLEFLKYFKAINAVNVASDTRRLGGEFDAGFQAFDVSLWSVDLGAALRDYNNWNTLDELRFTFGRYKHEIGREVHDSSKTLLTVERSSLSNFLFQSARPTAAVLELTKGKVDTIAALYSTTEGSRFINGFNDGLAYYAGLNLRATDEWTFLSEFIYNDAQEGDDSLLDYNWVGSLSAEYDDGERFGFYLNGILGDNGDASNGVTQENRQGLFGGVVFLPWYWVIPEKLQVVGRYQFAAAEESEGFRVNSRSLLDATSEFDLADINEGFGDINHSIYLGVNYLIKDHRFKVQAGVEYDTLQTANGDVSGFTTQLALRTTF